MAAPPQKPGPRPAAAAPSDVRAAAAAARADRHRTEALADACAKAEEELEALKARFELYFTGLERREPARERDELRKRVAKLKTEVTSNTGLRFRIDSLHARFLSYERMWQRSVREKEDGTYARDLERARRHARAAGKAPPGRDGAKAATAAPEPRPAPPPAGASPAPGSSVAPSASAPAARAPAAAAGTAGDARPPAGAAPSEAELRALYAEYVKARARCNEDPGKVTFEALARSVAKQVPDLVQRYGAKRVEFKVVVKDGRAVVKAVPRS